MEKTVGLLICVAAATVIGPAARAQVLPAAALCGPSAVAAAGPARATLREAPITFENRWAAAGQTTFSHVIEGPPGPVRLTLETCSTATGGETVAIYPATAAGQRMPRKPRVMFSIANPRGNMRTATVTIPKAGKGGAGSLHLVVIIENAAGRVHNGAYRITVSR